MATAMNINAATASNMTSNVATYTIDALNTDGIGDQEETEYQNTFWSTQWGQFNSVPDLKSAILMKAIWCVGKGYTADNYTMSILDHIEGFGKDSFGDILFNLDVTRRIGGDAFAEIIRDGDLIVNLKPLDPSSIKIIVGANGIIKRYEQVSKIKGKDKVIYKPEEILHLTNNRLADQIHGISDIKALEKTILADEQSFDDLVKVMHRQYRPLVMFKLGTDNEQDINTFVAKMDAAVNKGENIYVPNDKATVEVEVVQVNPSQMLLEWRAETRNRFFRSVGLPQIVPGAGGQSTESESKVIYLAFEQIVEREQRYLEAQIWNQLQLRINLVPPVSMAPNLASDTAKDGGASMLTMQPSDTQAGVGR